MYCLHVYHILEYIYIESLDYVYTEQDLEDIVSSSGWNAGRVAGNSFGSSPFSQHLQRLRSLFRQQTDLSRLQALTRPLARRTVSSCAGGGLKVIQGDNHLRGRPAVLVSFGWRG